VGHIWTCDSLEGADEWITGCSVRCVERVRGEGVALDLAVAHAASQSLSERRPQLYSGRSPGISPAENTCCDAAMCLHAMISSCDLVSVCACE
jgi:hypothetical protein